MTGPGAPGAPGETADAARSVDDVVGLYEHHAGQRYDEAVTQLDHALQTAALALADEAPDALVAAALLHDVGHLLALRDGTAADGQTAADLVHEARGARWLARLFPPSVTGPIALHVAAKRYRCAVDPTYHAALSPGSQASLVRQGGPMTAAEAARFEANPAHGDAVRLRGWDDGGKRTEALTVPTLADHVPLLQRLGAWHGPDRQLPGPRR